MAPFLNFQINPLAFSSSFQVFLQNSLTTSRCCHHCGTYVYLIYFSWLGHLCGAEEKLFPDIQGHCSLLLSPTSLPPTAMAGGEQVSQKRLTEDGALRMPQPPGPALSSSSGGCVPSDLCSCLAPAWEQESEGCGEQRGHFLAFPFYPTPLVSHK